MNHLRCAGLLMAVLLFLFSGAAVAEKSVDKKVEFSLKDEQIFIEPKEIYLRVEEGQIQGIRVLASRMLSDSEAEEYEAIFPERFSGKKLFLIQSTYEFTIWRQDSSPEKTVAFRILKQVYFDYSGRRIEENVFPDGYYHSLFQNVGSPFKELYSEERAIYRKAEDVVRREKIDNFLRY